MLLQIIRHRSLKDLPIEKLLVQQHALGADRVMMGSDLPSNTSTELEKVRSLGLTATQERKVLGETASRVFKI